MSERGRPAGEKPHTVIIGVGSEYGADDAVGWRVTRRLAREAAASRTEDPFGAPWEGVAISEAHGEGTGLMRLWRGASRAILVDAASGGGRAPGTIYRRDVSEEDLPAMFLRCSTHAFGVAEAIGLARVLGELPPGVIVYGVQGARFAPGESMSPVVEQAIPAVCARVRDELTSMASRW